MNYDGRRTSCTPVLMAVAAGVVALWAGGWAEFLSEKPPGVEAQRIVDQLSGVRPVTEPNITVPGVYKEPPRIVEQLVGGKPEFKLFYFCNYHTSDALRQVVHEQFATMIFDEKGKSSRQADYTVSAMPATNQLIVRCPNREDVEAVLELLQHVDVPPTQVKIDCVISEVYADKTLDWQTSTLIQELFGESIWAGPAGQPFGMDVSQLLQEVYASGIQPAFPGASLREIARSKMGLQMGYAGEKFLTLVDILESQGYLKILMNPTLEVVNGKTAKISSIQKVPLQRITVERPDWHYLSTQTQYEDVVDSLEITPHVFADNYIGLETNILLGSKLTPEGVKQLPIITKKQIDNKENRIRRGESLVIGGIRKSEKRDVVRGVPFLKDIPILGILFSGRDFEERVVETIFILTPTISTGGRPNEEVIEEVRRKHDPSSESRTLSEGITDPFGFKAREREQQRKTDEAEQARLRAQAETAEARHVAREAHVLAERAETQVQLATADASRVKADAEDLVVEAKASQEKAAAAAKQAQDQLETVKAALEKAKTDAQAAQAEIERLKAQVKEAEAKAAAAEKQTQTEIPKVTTEGETENSEKPKQESQQSRAGAADSQNTAGKAATGKNRADPIRPKQGEQTANAGAAERA